MTFSKLDLACGGCCNPLCNKKWTPQDDIDRHLSFDGVGVVLDSHPFADAEDLHLPLDVLPDSPVDLLGGGDFAHGSGQGIGYFGLSSGAHRLTWGVKKETADETHSLDQSSVGVVHDLSTPDNSAGVPMDWADTIAPPNCHRQGYWGTGAPAVETNYGVPEDDPLDPIEITYDKLVAMIPRYVKGDIVRAVKCKMIVGGYVWAGAWPKTYAEMGPQHSLVDAVVLVHFNYSLGWTPTSTLNVSLDNYYDFDPLDPPFVHPAIYSINKNEPQPIVRQPDGNGGIGWGELKRIRGATYGGHTIRRKIRESVQVGARGRFRNGHVELDARVSAYLHSSAQRAYAPEKFGEPNPEFVSQSWTGAVFYPDVAAENIPLGPPRPLTTYVNAGFSTMQIAFDAEWNADSLKKFINYNPQKSVYAMFTWDPTADPDDLPPEVSGLNFEIKGRSSPHTSVGLSLRPLHECENVYRFNLQTTREGEYYNIFQANYRPTPQALSVFTSDETKNKKWRKTPEFTEDLQLTPGPFTMSASGGIQQVGFGKSALGNVVGASGYRFPAPSFTLHGSGSSPTFTRLED